MVPQYEENPNPDKAVSIEFFFGEWDGSEQAIERLNHIKSLLADDKSLFPETRTDVIAVSPRTGSLSNTRDFQKFMRQMGFQDKKVHYQEVPEFLDYTAKFKKEKKADRLPSSLMDGRKFWTLVRTSSSMAGTFSALYFMEGLSVPLATSVAIWPGLA